MALRGGAFRSEGADVTIVYLAEHRDAEVTKAAIEKEGRRCLLISGDVRDHAFAGPSWRKR